MAERKINVRPGVCSDCSCVVNLEDAEHHVSWHAQLGGSLDSAETVLDGMTAAIRVLERQAQQLLERVSQLEAGAAWRQPGGPAGGQLEGSWRCPVCGHHSLVLVLGGRNPGLRCGGCSALVSSG